MMTELMTEILKNLFGKCGNRMISHENAPGIDSYGSVHLRKDVQTHLLWEKLFWNRYRCSRERKNIENLGKSFKFPFTWAKGWTIAKSIHFVRSSLATVRPVRGVPRKILSIEHSNISYNLVWKRKNMILKWFDHFSSLQPESSFSHRFTKEILRFPM